MGIKEACIASLNVGLLGGAEREAEQQNGTMVWKQEEASWL